MEFIFRKEILVID